MDQDAKGIANGLRGVDVFAHGTILMVIVTSVNL